MTATSEARRLGAVDTEIVRNQFQGIVDEMGRAVMQAAHTVFVRETGDFGVCLVSTRGEVFAATGRIGLWITAGMPAGEAFRQVADYEAGDVVIANDPRSTRGLLTHLPDLMVWRPIFAGGRLLCFALSFVHASDVGGLAPGSVVPSASDINQEGIVIPPIKLVAAGALREDVLRLVLANSRVPDHNWGDVKAMLGALAGADRRLQGLLEKYGVGFVEAGIDAVLDYAERQARRVIERIPDGDYRFWDYLEGDVVPGGRPIRIVLDMRVRGGGVTLDFSDTDPQVRAALNLHTWSQDGHHMVVLQFLNYIRSVLPHAVYNSGLARPLKLVAAPGSLLNPEEWASCAARQATMFRVADVIQGALALAVSDEVPAAGAGMGAVAVLGVRDPSTGRLRVSTVQPLVGGSGGRPQTDGIDGVDFATGYFRNIPTEVLEREMPVLVRRYLLRPDSGGPGRHRGGHGLDYELEVLAPDGVMSARGMERYFFEPWGRDGGMPGAIGSTILSVEGDAAREIGKIDQLQVPVGARVRFLTQGGGGFGHPFERDPDLVVADVRAGLLSLPRARSDYGVVVTGGSWDRDATAKLRAARREPATPRFDHGVNRRRHEALWSDQLQTAVNKATAGRPAALRDHLRSSLIREIEKRAAAGEVPTPAEVPALLTALNPDLQRGLERTTNGRGRAR